MSEREKPGPRPKRRVALVHEDTTIEILPLRETIGDPKMEYQELVHTLVARSAAWGRLADHMARKGYPLSFQKTSQERTFSAAKDVNGVSYHKVLLEAVSEHGVNLVMDVFTQAEHAGLGWKSSAEGGQDLHLNSSTFKRMVDEAATSVRYETLEIDALHPAGV